MAFIPLYDSNPLRHISRPWVTYAFILINIVVFFFIEGGGFSGADRATVITFGLIPATLGDLAMRPEDLELIPDYLTLITYAFFHGDFWHLLGNMLFLWVFGDNVEDSLGHVRYFIFYCLCAVGAGLAFYISVPTSESPLIGASGAIAGVVAAYLVLHPHAKIWILIFARIPIRISALWVLGFWLAYQIYGIVTSGESEVAWWSHIGGFVTGAILVLFLKRRGIRLFDRGPAPG
jgi:membrane associated rhomboid family serine protease